MLHVVRWIFLLVGGVVRQRRGETTNQKYEQTTEQTAEIEEEVKLNGKRFVHICMEVPGSPPVVDNKKENKTANRGKGILRYLLRPPVAM